jgi:hypothetical protein
VSIATATRAETELDRVYPWVVKSRRQSELLNAWLECRSHHSGLPAFSDFADATQRYPDQDELTVYKIVHEADTLRYLIVKESVGFQKILGRASTGRFLDEVLPPLSWRTAQPTFDACVRQQLPVYIAFSFVERDGENTLCERLLLPFGAQTAEATTILSAFKTTTWKDPTARATELDAREPRYSFGAVIALLDDARPAFSSDLDGLGQANRKLR